MAGFPRSARLLAAGDFERAFARRPAFRGRYFVLHRSESDHGASSLPTCGPADPAAPAGPRLGLVVPKKLLKTAVHRNLVKRLAREAFRAMSGRIARSDLVVRLAVRLNPRTAPLDRRAIAADLASLFARAERTAEGR